MEGFWQLITVCASRMENTAEDIVQTLKDLIPWLILNIGTVTAKTS